MHPFDEALVHNTHATKRRKCQKQLTVGVWSHCTGSGYNENRVYIIPSPALFSLPLPSIEWAFGTLDALCTQRDIWHPLGSVRFPRVCP